MFLNIKVFENLCASIFGKDLEKIRIPEMPQMIFITVGVLGFLLSLYIPMFRMAEQF